MRATAFAALPDGTLTGTWTADTERFTAWVAACSCGWRDDHAHQPDEAGREAALDRWDEHHAEPLLERTVPREVAELVERTRSAVAHLAEVRPQAASTVLDRIDRWSNILRERTVARGAGTATIQQRLDELAERARHGRSRVGR